MTHIEFIGASGSGKSTILDGLTNKPDFIGGESYIYECSFFCGKRKLTRYVVPKHFREYFGQKIWNNYKKFTHFQNFVGKNPQFVSCSVDFLRRQHANDDPEYSKRKIQYMFDTMAKYELLNTLAGHPPWPCLSEGFYHKVLASAPLSEFPSNKYFETIPQPDILVWVNPHLETIQKRQAERDGEVTSIDELKREEETIRKIVSFSQRYDTKLIEVKNNGRLTETMNEIYPSLVNTLK